jgi:hypothetical protein
MTMAVASATATKSNAVMNEGIVGTDSLTLGVTAEHSAD